MDFIFTEGEALALRAEGAPVVVQFHAGIGNGLFCHVTRGLAAFEKADHVGRHQRASLAARSVFIGGFGQQRGACRVEINNGAVGERADALETAELGLHFEADEFHCSPAVELFFCAAKQVDFALRATLSCGRLPLLLQRRL